MSSELVVSLILFTVVGLIVSMDVSGLTLSKTEEFLVGRESLPLWALSNAIWHAGLLSIYILVISGIIRISPEYIDGLRWLAHAALKYLPSIRDDVLEALLLTTNALKEHLSLILGMVALYVVWTTYSAKIISKPELADIDDLSPLARSTFDLLDLVIRVVAGGRLSQVQLRRFITTQAQAALVAVDMLALAILLRTTNAIKSPAQSITVVCFVFFIVLFITIGASRIGIQKYKELSTQNRRRKFSVKSLEWVRITLRLAEPFLIFYFVLQLVALLLLQKQVHGASLLFGAALLVMALIERYTLPLIVENCLANAEPQNALPLRGLSVVVNDLGHSLLFAVKSLLYLSIEILLFAAYLWIRYSPLPNMISFDAELSYIVGGIAIITTVAFFPGFRRLDPLEQRVIKLFKAIAAQRKSFLFMAGALFIATVFPVYDELVDVASKSGDQVISLSSMFQSNHRHALQFGIWLFFLFALGLLLDIAERRHRIKVGSRNSDIDNTYYWQWHYPTILTLGGLLLWAIGWLLQRIAT